MLSIISVLHSLTLTVLFFTNELLIFVQYISISLLLLPEGLIEEYLYISLLATISVRNILYTTISNQQHLYDE